MHPRQDTVEIFSTFIQFDNDRFSCWATDSHLRRSMKKSLNQTPTETSDNFWALYWHQVWLEQPNSLAKGHLTAYLQEICFWSSQKTINGFDSTQYKLSDCFQVGISRIDKVLKGFDRQRGFDLKSYASITFANLIRELLRQKKEVDICSDWSLLRKLSQKRMTEALLNAGLDSEVVKSHVLAWNCFKTMYVPERASSTRKLPKPKPDTWAAIANLYNQQKTQLVRSPRATAENIEEWMLVCVKVARSYLFPSVTSINQPKLGYESGEIADSLIGVESLLGDAIANELAQQRSQQQRDINQFLTATIKRLKTEEQQLLKLYYSLELKQAEIAKQLNTQQYSVSRKLARTRTELLKALAKWSQETMHISLTSDILNNISSLLEEWLASYYHNQ